MYWINGMPVDWFVKYNPVKIMGFLFCRALCRQDGGVP
jgi:hypothetical protein